MASPQPPTVVWDDEQPVDHTGDVVAPLTPAGMPYRYRLRLRYRSLYAVDADQVLAAVIDDYPTPPTDTEQLDRSRSAGPVRGGQTRRPGAARVRCDRRPRRPGDAQRPARP